MKKDKQRRRKMQTEKENKLYTQRLLLQIA